MNAVEQIINNTERLYTKLEVEKMRQAIEKSGITEDEFKALLLDVTEPEDIITICGTKRYQDGSGKL